jgi:hypothetical protein
MAASTTDSCWAEAEEDEGSFCFVQASDWYLIPLFVSRFRLFAYASVCSLRILLR